MRIAKSLFALLLIAASSQALAAWQDEISPYDRERLKLFDESRGRGLSAAQGGTAAEQAIVQSALGGTGGPISEQELVGNWRCRIIKLGGLTPVQAYGWLNCRIRRSGNGLFFEKLSGTQRISGYIDPYQGSYILLGAYTVGRERQKPYSGGTFGAGSVSTSSDAVGILSKVGPGHARIEFPYPVLESVFDIIELKR